MRLNKKYRIILEDESSLRKRVNVTTPFPLLILILFAGVVLAGGFGIFILASTPLKNYLPGYLKASERTATEEQHLRLDSLVKVYEINEAYVAGILNALNPQEEMATMQRNESRTVPLQIDSLLPASEEEKKFIETIRERDKYNIAVVSPAAAQSLMFGSVNKSAVISEASKGGLKAELVIPVGSPVTSIADGKVISIASSPKTSGGYEIIIQHPKGFLSKISRLNHLLVQPGDRVVSGQIIATSTAQSGMKSNHVIVELWHDGNPLIPAQYLNGGKDWAPKTL